MPDWDEIRPTTHVITSPTLRPDGSLLQKPGHDEATGILYKPSTEFPVVDEEPSLDNCRDHAREIAGVVRDFPFATSASLSAWMAGLFTCVARSAIDGPCPLFAVNATAAATGKTRLATTTAQLAFGREPACFSQPDDKEFEKRISLAVSEDIPLCVIDNISRPLKSDVLSMALTAREWTTRGLGSSRAVTRPMRTVWWATGNNLSLGDDIARRTLEIRLKRSCEHQDERTDFLRPDLLSWVKQERTRLVASALTIVRGFVVAGRPGRNPAWGSFESWSALIPGVLTWLGYDDPLTMRWKESHDWARSEPLVDRAKTSDGVAGSDADVMFALGAVLRGDLGAVDAATRVVSTDDPPMPIGHIQRALTALRASEHAVQLLKHKGLDVELVSYRSGRTGVRERSTGAFFVVDAEGGIWRIPR